MRIYKFGGASVKNAEAVRNMTRIVQAGGNALLVVVSAMGKTTNALETLHQKWRSQEDVSNTLQELYNFHHEIAQELLITEDSLWMQQWQKLQSYLQQTPSGEFDETYDQIIPFGEILSSSMIHDHWNSIGFRHLWLDATHFIDTDNRPREARIKWESTSEKMDALDRNATYITQGFIGKYNNKSLTTLGREGSDYSASIFAHCLNAESVTIWKDVAGMLNADPKKHADAVLIPHLSYAEAIELAYYGASVIHPKTIQPLQQKGIPLHIRSFISPQDAGTSIGEFAIEKYPACFIEKDGQFLISISTLDFGFIVEDNLEEIFSEISNRGIKIQMMENGARSFSMCVQCEEEKLLSLQAALKSRYKMRYNANVTLITIRHYRAADLQKMENLSVLLEQKNRTIARFVVQNA
jgi:aspartate kinase